jgi:hypothetical protein
MRVEVTVVSSCSPQQRASSPHPKGVRTPGLAKRDGLGWPQYKLTCAAAVDRGLVWTCLVEAPATAQDHCWSANEVKVGHRMYGSLVVRCVLLHSGCCLVVKMSVEVDCCPVVRLIGVCCSTRYLDCCYLQMCVVSSA